MIKHAHIFKLIWLVIQIFAKIVKKQKHYITHKAKVIRNKKTKNKMIFFFFLANLS